MQENQQGHVGEQLVQYDAALAEAHQDHVPQLCRRASHHARADDSKTEPRYVGVSIPSTEWRLNSNREPPPITAAAAAVAASAAAVLGRPNGNHQAQHHAMVLERSQRRRFSQSLMQGTGGLQQGLHRPAPAARFRKRRLPAMSERHV
jgi:hypothetical protein